MSIQQELDEFLAGAVARRGLQFDPGGIAHTHNKADPAAPLPPFKFNLCTSVLRAEGRLTEDDMDQMAALICHGIIRTKPRPQAIVGIPNVGADIAHRVELCLRREGLYLPRLRLSKQDGGFSIVDDAGYKSGELCAIDDLIHKGLSKRRCLAAFESAGYQVTDCWVFLTYEQGGEEYFDKLGTAVHAISTVRRTLELGKYTGVISGPNYQAAMDYLTQTSTAAV